MVIVRLEPLLALLINGIDHWVDTGYMDERDAESLRSALDMLEEARASRVSEETITKHLRAVLADSPWADLVPDLKPKGRKR